MHDALEGVRVVDLSVNAPGPYATRMLADLGAEVTRIVNPAQTAPDYAGAAEDPLLSARGGPGDALSRGKAVRALDLKDAAGRAALLAMLAEADVLVSEMRPGKLEALGLGWADLHPRFPRLVLCEITGYGRSGPLAGRAGHDINYLALSGALSLIRDREGRPVPPQNLVADYAAGGGFGLSGILAALLRRERTGQGSHLNVSMAHGIRTLMTDIAAHTVHSGHPEESWRGTLGGGMPTYGVYETADGGWMAVGALEPKFIAVLAEALDWPELPALVAAKATWGQARAGLEARFATRSRDDWWALFAPLDACVTPVLTLDELQGAGLPDLAEAIGATAPLPTGPAET